MLKVLHLAEDNLPDLLQDEDLWQSLHIDYHPPIVERLWTEMARYRVYLHRIHPCARDEALLHPHPWPSAIRVVSGTYEMGVGYGQGMQKPLLAARIILAPKSEYEMLTPDGWHYVRPLEEPSYSVMVTGKPWDRPSPKSEGPLGPLSKEQRIRIFEFFRTIYKP